MPFDAPFTLGPFTVDDTGRLAPLPNGGLPHFRLRWRMREVDITFTRGRPAIMLSLALGRIPSTAKPMRQDITPVRDHIFRMLRGLPGCLPNGWHTVLGADHSLVLRMHSDIDMPARATDVLARIVSFLIDVSPYLDLLDEDGLDSPAGTVD